MKCYYCLLDGGHHTACPEDVDVSVSQDLRRRWQEGWEKGREGGLNPKPEDETFTLGFQQGEAMRAPKPQLPKRMTADGRQEVRF